ncbi:MAG: type I restriction enzyme HsdR N-terminal domain-containing protein [Cyclobacteriaceae bacterium]|nr:type I restriction enzyme HsdR N-terminal domain-containing protein [Cyclobacteriaceae bacterium]
MDDFIFPPCELKLKKESGKTTIFDIIRKKYIVLTAEEWIRQHLVHFMVNELKYPRSLIAVEDGLSLNSMQKRSDVVVYDRAGNIFLVVECKSIKVKLTQKTMDQLSAYNQHYKARYLVITNGLELLICRMDYEGKKSEFVTRFPDLP